MPIDDQTDLPRIAIRDDSDEALRLIRSLQTAVLKHPSAAQAIFSALVAEGKRYAETENGRVWQARLIDSALFQRAQNVFQSATLWMLEDAAPQDLPSGYLDAVFMAAENPQLETLLQNVLAQDEDGDESTS